MYAAPPPSSELLRLGALLSWGVAEERLTQGRVPWLSNVTGHQGIAAQRKIHRSGKERTPKAHLPGSNSEPVLLWNLPPLRWRCMSGADPGSKAWQSMNSLLRRWRMLDAGNVAGTPRPLAFYFQCLLFYPQIDWVCYLNQECSSGLWAPRYIPAETNELFSNPHGLPASAISFFSFF